MPKVLIAALFRCDLCEWLLGRIKSEKSCFLY